MPRSALVNGCRGRVETSEKGSSTKNPNRSGFRRVGFETPGVRGRFDDGRCFAGGRPRWSFELSQQSVKGTDLSGGEREGGGIIRMEKIKEEEIGDQTSFVLIIHRVKGSVHKPWCQPIMGFHEAGHGWQERIGCISHRGRLLEAWASLLCAL